MTFSTLLTRSWLLAFEDIVPPTVGTMDYQKILTIANTYIDQWQDEPGVNWDSLYIRQQLTPTVTATDTFALHANIRKISQRDGDYVVITRSGGTKDYYTVVPPDQLQEHSDSNACAQIGTNLVFASAFADADPQANGTIKVPGYSAATAMTGDSSTVPVDNPEWLIYMTAAELIKDDEGKKTRLEYLQNLADKTMMRMKIENRAQVETKTQKARKEMS